ncbi:PspA/IM30 family protein [Capilliphycus salinus ALCB114379]|uniref:PspA/IM30 family protein n=1 Tax=Capilliphycus salinus TaxID=2768948 RepID=UPI0039A4595D
MGLLDRVGRLIRANLNDIIEKAEDPQKILEQAIIDMHEDVIKLREAVTLAIASQKRSQQQYNQYQSEVNNWQSRAQLALQKGDENLAREALQRKKSYQEQANIIKVALDSQTAQVETLKRNLIQLESKISEAKTKKEMLIARKRAADVNKQLQDLINGINTTGSIAAFERMEEKVLVAEARSQGLAELAGADLESQFQALEAGNGIDDELEALKAQMLGGSAQPQGQLPAGEAPAAPETQPQKPKVDTELEELRQKLQKI